MAKTRCPKCRGKLVPDDGELKCINCGHVQTSRSEKHKFYEVHKQEILADADRLGEQAMRNKWGIPSTSWYQLKGRWSPLVAATSPPNGPPTGTLPPLPPFNDQWVPEVQIKWLEIWDSLHNTIAA
jgi:hypothetical protein